MKPAVSARSKDAENIDNLKNNLIQTLTDYFYRKLDKETVKGRIFDISNEFDKMKPK